MTQEEFIRREEGIWQRAERILFPIPGERKKEKARNQEELPALFRRLSQDLNTARSLSFDPRLINRLNDMVIACHQRIYGTRLFNPRPLLRFWTHDFPLAARRHSRAILFAHLLFYLPVLFVFLLVQINPDTAYDIVSWNALLEMEEMYNPQAEHFLEPRGIESDAEMFAFYIYNNISIAFRTFAGGLLAGIGSLLLLFFNALYMGAVLSYLTNQGMAMPLFTFMAGHSSFELTAIILSALGGLKLGWSLLVPGRFSRGEALGRQAGEMLPLLYGAFLFLVIAACIEGFWSAQPFPAWIKFSAGGAGWLFVLFYLFGLGRLIQTSRPGEEGP